MSHPKKDLGAILLRKEKHIGWGGGRNERARGEKQVRKKNTNIVKF